MDICASSLLYVLLACSRSHSIRSIKFLSWFRSGDGKSQYVVCIQDGAEETCSTWRTSCWIEVLIVSTWLIMDFSEI